MLEYPQPYTRLVPLSFHGYCGREIDLSTRNETLQMNELQVLLHAFLEYIESNLLEVVCVRVTKTKSTTTILAAVVVVP